MNYLFGPNDRADRVLTPRNSLSGCDCWLLIYKSSQTLCNHKRCPGHHWPVTLSPRPQVPAPVSVESRLSSGADITIWLSRDRISQSEDSRVTRVWPIRGSQTMDKLMQHKLDELHLTQLNLVLLNNFYKQIYEGGKSLKPLSIVVTVITIVSTLDYEAHNCTFNKLCWETQQRWL